MKPSFKILSVCFLAAVFSVSPALLAKETNVSHLAWLSGITATGCLAAGTTGCLKEGIVKLYECQNSQKGDCLNASVDSCVEEGTHSCINSAKTLLAAYLIFLYALPLDEILQDWKNFYFETEADIQ